MKDSLQAILFPLGGIDNSAAVEDQHQRVLQGGQRVPTTPSALNVRGNDPTSGRDRGGQRSGLSKYCPVVMVSSLLHIQDINQVAYPSGDPPEDPADPVPGTCTFSNGARTFVGSQWHYEWDFAIAEGPGSQTCTVVWSRAGWGDTTQTNNTSAHYTHDDANTVGDLFAAVYGQNGLLLSMCNVEWGA